MNNSSNGSSPNEIAYTLMAEFKNDFRENWTEVRTFGNDFHADLNIYLISYIFWSGQWPHLLGMSKTKGSSIIDPQI